MQAAPMKAFGVALSELAAAGQPPVVLQDCLRWMALRGLTTPRLFNTPSHGDKRKLLALRHLYDTGRRPLRSKSCRDKDPHLIANLLLLWLGSLPEPLFPGHLVPELVEGQQSDYYEERVASVRSLLKRADPFVVEALFPLFELLHHYWINQPDRDSALQELGRQLAPSVFGTPMQHSLPAEDAGLLSDTVEMLVSEYRPLFTQPFNLRRYEADAARQAAAEAQRVEAVLMAAACNGGSPPQGSPLLTPIRCQRLSVMDPEGTSPFSDCCATPLAPESPISAFLAAAADQASWRGSGVGVTSFQMLPPSAFGGSGSDSASLHHYQQGSLEEDAHLELAFSSLMESTISGMLFDSPLCGPGLGGAAEGDADLAPADLAPAQLVSVRAKNSAAVVDADMQPMSPVAVVRESIASDGGDDSTDGSDCDAPMAVALATGKSPFAWPRGATCCLGAC